MFICHAVSALKWARQSKISLENVVHPHVTSWLLDRSVWVSNLLRCTESVWSLGSVRTSSLWWSHTARERGVLLWVWKLCNLTSCLRSAADGKSYLAYYRKLAGGWMNKNGLKILKQLHPYKKLNARYWLHCLRRAQWPAFSWRILEFFIKVIRSQISFG